METQLLPPKRGTAPHFSPMSVEAKRLDGSRCHLLWRWASAWPRPHFLHGDTAVPTERGTTPHAVSRFMDAGLRPYKPRPMLLGQNGWMDQDSTWDRGRPQPRRYCATWGPRLHEKGTPVLQLFRAYLSLLCRGPGFCAVGLDNSSYASCTNAGRPASVNRSPCLLCLNGRPSQLLLYIVHL